MTHVQWITYVYSVDLTRKYALGSSELTFLQNLDSEIFLFFTRVIVKARYRQGILFY